MCGALFFCIRSGGGLESHYCRAGGPLLDLWLRDAAYLVKLLEDIVH